MYNLINIFCRTQSFTAKALIYINSFIFEFLKYRIYGTAFLLFLIFHPFFSASTDAYYSQTKKDSDFIHERSQAQWQKGNRVFVLYDNYTYYIGGGSHLPLLTPISGEFVPADYVNGNMPLADFFRPSLIVEDPVANMLYANLRLVKLIEEYADTQKKAYELMNDIEKMKSYYAVALIPSWQKVNPNPDLVVAGTGPKGTAVNFVKKWSEKSRRDKVAVRSARGRFAALKDYSKIKDDSEHEALADMYHSIRDIAQKRTLTDQTTDSQGSQSGSGLSGTKTTITSPYSSGRSSSGRPYSQETYNDQPRQKETEPYYDSDIPLPWIIKTPLNVIQYIVENKFESFIYFIAILIPILLISSAKPR